MSFVLIVGKVTKSRGQNKETRFFFVETEQVRDFWRKVTEKIVFCGMNPND
jgi:hypothetical protein